MNHIFVIQTIRIFNLPAENYLKWDFITVKVVKK